MSGRPLIRRDSGGSVSGLRAQVELRPAQREPVDGKWSKKRCKAKQRRICNRGFAGLTGGLSELRRDVQGVLTSGPRVLCGLRSGETSAALEIEVLRANEGEARSPRKPDDQRHRPARLPHAKIGGVTPRGIKPEGRPRVQHMRANGFRARDTKRRRDGTRARSAHQGSQYLVFTGAWLSKAITYTANKHPKETGGGGGGGGCRFASRQLKGFLRALGHRREGRTSTDNKVVVPAVLAAAKPGRFAVAQKFRESYAYSALSPRPRGMLLRRRVDIVRTYAPGLRMPLARLPVTPHHRAARLEWCREGNANAHCSRLLLPNELSKAFVNSPGQRDHPTYHPLNLCGTLWDGVWCGLQYRQQISTICNNRWNKRGSLFPKMTSGTFMIVSKARLHRRQRRVHKILTLLIKTLCSLCPWVYGPVIIITYVDLRRGDAIRLLSPFPCMYGTSLTLLVLRAPSGGSKGANERSASFLDDVIRAVLPVPQPVKVCYNPGLGSPTCSCKFCQTRVCHTNSLERYHLGNDAEGCLQKSQNALLRSVFRWQSSGGR
ncbi:hypothetical protein PR048_006874 [Dryococelus australis]|uniref:Uncharacterized protein n=1 Tax=Dryococelus australis TaxID=614101 RepID=A0ABQ9ICR9_9NEOP|nr:hypothetical protein PR048_006874 [Dryococelus australis]